MRVPERELVVGARGGDDVARVGDDASRVGSDVGRVGDDASRVGGDVGRMGDDVSRGGTGAVGDRPPMSPVAHAGGDGPGSTSTSTQMPKADGDVAPALTGAASEPRTVVHSNLANEGTGSYGYGGTGETHSTDPSGASTSHEATESTGVHNDPEDGRGNPGNDASPVDAASDSVAQTMGHDLNAIQALESKIPDPPKTPGDIVLDSGDHAYFRSHSTSIGYDSLTTLNRDLTAQIDGFHDIVVHGNPQGYFLPGRINHAGVDFHLGEVHAGHIVQAVRNNPDYTGGPVRLLSCHSARVLDGIDEILAAQRVANDLGVPVKAPTEAVGIYPHLPPGQASIVFNGGYWRTFLPIVG